MDVATFRDLFDYHRWANARVWDRLSALDDERFTRDLDYSVGSLHTQTLHTIVVEWWWIGLMRSGENVFRSHDEFPDRDAIAVFRSETDTRTARYVATLTSDDLGRRIRADHWGPERGAVTIRDALLQLVNHSTDHRAQTLAGLRRLGGPTIAQDYLYRVFERERSKAGGR